MSLQFDNNKQKVEEACNRRAKKSERCARPETEILSCPDHKEYERCESEESDGEDLDLRTLGL